MPDCEDAGSLYLLAFCTENIRSKDNSVVIQLFSTIKKDVSKFTPFFPIFKKLLDKSYIHQKPFYTELAL